MLFELIKRLKDASYFHNSEQHRVSLRMVIVSLRKLSRWLQFFPADPCNESRLAVHSYGFNKVHSFIFAQRMKLQNESHLKLEKDTEEQLRTELIFEQQLEVEKF